MASELTSHARTSPTVGGRIVDALLLVMLLCLSWTKLFVNAGGKLDVAFVVTAVYVVAFIAWRLAAGRTRIPQAAAWLAAWGGVMLAIDLVGYTGIATAIGRTQFAKAFVFAVLAVIVTVCVTAHLAERGSAFTTRAVRWFIAGFVVSAGYSIAQFMLLAGAGRDLDRIVIDRIPVIQGGTSGVLYYGGGIYRVTGLMLDTNHLGVVLVIPLALAVGFLTGWARAATILICGGSMLLTLSRSGMLGAGVALLVFAAFNYRRIFTPRVVAALIAVVGVVAASVFVLVATSPELARQLFLARLDPNSAGVQSHLNLYGTIPPLLMQAPLFGLGLNAFALHFVDISGRADFGPHSMWIKLLVENGLVGTTVYIAFAVAFVRRMVRVGGMQAAAVAAAFLGTLGANLFYLTTHFFLDEIVLAIGGALMYVAACERGQAAISGRKPQPAAPARVPDAALTRAPAATDG